MKIDEKKLKKVQGIVIGVAMTIMLISALIPILMIDVEWVEFLRYTFAFGAALTFLARVTEKNDMPNLRVRRLHRMEGMAAMLYCVSAFLVLYSDRNFGGHDWIAFLLAGAVLQCYASFVIQYEEKKQEKKKK